MMSNYLGFVLLIKLNYKLTEPLSVYPTDVKFRISIAHISGDITYNILSLFPQTPHRKMHSIVIKIISFCFISMFKAKLGWQELDNIIVILL